MVIYSERENRGESLTVLKHYSLPILTSLFIPSSLSNTSRSCIQTSARLKAPSLTTAFPKSPTPFHLRPHEDGEERSPTPLFQFRCASIPLDPAGQVSLNKVILQGDASAPQHLQSMRNTCLAVGMTLEEAIRTAKNYKQEMGKMCKGNVEVEEAGDN